MNSFWQRPPLSSEMENSHEIYKGGNCSFAAGSSGSVDQGAGRKASDEYRRHNIYTESFQIILSGKQRLCFWINAESKKSFLVFFYSYHTGSFDVFLS